MAILVTGGAGFIGSHVCSKLFEEGENVVCIDDFNDYYDPKLKERRAEGLKHKNFTLYRSDIRDPAKLKEIFSKHQINSVVHLAARAGVRASIADPLLYESVNVQGTINLLEMSKKVSNFVFASSSSVYGGNTKTPFSETDIVDNPISPYAATKKAGELISYTYSHIYKIPVSCLRFFTVYGPMGRPDMAMYKFTKAITEGKPLTRYGDGSSQRDYTYIKDIVEGIVAALRNPRPYEIYNLGNSKPIKLSYMISLVEKEVGRKAIIEEQPMPEADVPITFADITKAKKLLSWQPKTSVEEGVKELVRWYKRYSG